MNPTATKTYSSPRLYTTAPPLCSTASVLDAFVVEGAVAYALTATSPEVQSDSLETLPAWRQYFLEVFQRESSYRENILQCQPRDAQRILDAMQDLSKASWTEEPFKVVLEVALLRLAETRLLYPRNLMLDNVSGVAQSPLKNTIGQVIRGSLNDKVVGIKTSGLRLDDSIGMVSKHILSWTLLKHENVLPLHGVCTIPNYNESGPFNRFGLVSPIMENGNIIDFLDKNPSVDRRFLILDVAAGLSYLHDNGIVHGRIHCYNILVTDAHPPRACLADFGLAHVMPVGTNTGLRYKYNSDSPAGKRVNYLLAPEDDLPTNSFSQTKASDIYAFSVASHEILTGRLIPTPVMEIASSSDELDSRSEIMMQQLLVDCCQPDAERRPSACQIVERLKNVIEMNKRMQEDKILQLEDRVEIALDAILNNLEYHRRLISRDRSSTQRILDAFQLLLDTKKFQHCRTQLIAVMRRISENSGLYPAHFFLEDGVTNTVEGPITAGGFADIYKAHFQGRQLCLKLTRRLEVNYVNAREAIVWAQLLHPNVLPFLGLAKYQERLCFVTCWATNGNLESYLEQNPGANRLLLCLDTAAGVEYLHQNNVVHGDLKGANILVDASGRASLGDFGVSSVTDPQILQWTSQSNLESKGGTVRWQAPELLAVDSDIVHSNTKASDVFAWANICYQIFTGRPPYFESLKPVPVLNKILSGVTPTRPDDSDIAWQEHGLDNGIWNMMQGCWKFKPSERLTMDEVILKLDVVKPIDTRPPMEWDEDVSMCFRHAQSKNLLPSFWTQLDELLSPIISPSDS
ncbi:hypothetical protein H0H92_001984 [Tricholoma furcatifolium]|nr:hypothetical protein H0H92_001984 [Tricholoma furcatifolium]